MNTSQEIYKIFAEYYDIYIRNYSEDLAFYISLCEKKHKIVEIGCGTGRILQYFLDNGFNITGIDISKEMLDKAREKLNTYLNLGNLKLLNHDLTGSFLSDKYDIALITFYTFNYIIEKPLLFLKNLYKSIHDGGYVIMDLFYPTSLQSKSIKGKWIDKELTFEGRLIKIRDYRNIENNIESRTQIYIEDGEEITIQTSRRYFTPGEISQLMNKAGFRNIQFSVVFDNEKFVNVLNESDLHKNFVVRAQK